MDLSKISNQELVSRIEKLAHSERKITHLILWHINEIESRKLYAEFGFGSMYEYLTRHLGYGESSAYRRIQSARLLKKIPHLAEKLETGALNLTQLTQVQKCLKEERKAGSSIDIRQTTRVLKQIENKSNHETQKFLAIEFNQPIQAHETLKLQRDESIRLEITLTQEQMKTLQHAKDLLSHILPEANWADVISVLADKHVKKVLGKNHMKSRDEENEVSHKSPRENATIAAKNLIHEKPKSVTKMTSRFVAKQERKSVKITTKRKLLTSANHCCEYLDPKTKRKCQSPYQLQIDHRIPFALGGAHELQNFRVLCRTHNLLAAQKSGLLK